MQARYYDPVIGRFYSNDPVGFRDVHSFNRYAYANNNPYKYVDPTGMSNVDIVVQRTSETTKSTSGTINVTSTGSSKTFSGVTLEPPKVANTTDGNGTVRMVAGTYDAEVRGPSQTGNYDKVQLKGAILGEDGKSHTEIQIHAGNDPTDSKGCLLAGYTGGVDKVNYPSRTAVNDIMSIVSDTQANDAKTGDNTTITVTIKDINP
jgi:hypothetical protein